MNNYFFELKIKELQALKKPFKIIDDVLLIMDGKNYVSLGCKHCYMQKPEPCFNGFKITKGELINYYEKYKEQCTVPKEIAINCWLCPHCGGLFRELLPEMEIFEINDVSI